MIKCSSDHQAQYELAWPGQWRRFGSPTRPQRRRPVTSLHGASGAFAWAPVALRRLVAYDCLPREALKNALSNRTLTTSSAFSGIGSDAAADACIAAAGRDVLHELGHNQQPPLRFISLYNIEIVGTCRNEVLSGPDPPRCMFGDILEFAPPKLRGLCMRAMADAKLQNGQDTIHMEQLREALPKAVPKLTGYCFVHDRVCRMRRATGMLRARLVWTIPG